MCGIFAALFRSGGLQADRFMSDNDLSRDKEYFMKIQHRGPDNSSFFRIPSWNLSGDSNVVMGFHRLAINGLDKDSNQPIQLDNKYFLICNGEIYNYKEIAEKYNFKLKTHSDCEIILHLYKKFQNIKAINNHITESEFFYVLYDSVKNIAYISRDIFGVRPGFYSYSEKSIYIASEAKALTFRENIKPFPPAHYFLINMEHPIDSPPLAYGKFFQEYSYYDLKLMSEYKIYPSPPESEIYSNIQKLLTDSVKKRLMSDRPLGCFLSGGLDSSLVAAIAHKINPNLQYFTIGLKNGLDVEASKKVVSYLNIPPENHHIVEFTVSEGFDVIRQVIYQLETYDITTIRASIPQFLLAKYISLNTNIRVLLCGGGSDELFNGYQYGKKIFDGKILEEDSCRLLSELYMFDNLREDRTTAAWGLELRFPFLNKLLVEYIFQLDPTIRFSNSQIEKKLLRNSFIKWAEEKIPLLPSSILFRRKEAFSDAVSSNSESWYKSLQRLYIDRVVSDKDMEIAKSKWSVNTPETREAVYYRSIFNEFYPGRDQLISHYWLPPSHIYGSAVVDPSATILSCYESSDNLRRQL
jgi:asparagine synthase (glutamine-hydrolysing)